MFCYIDVMAAGPFPASIFFDGQSNAESIMRSRIRSLRLIMTLAWCLAVAFKQQTAIAAAA